MHGILCHEFMCLGERGDFSDAMSYFKLQLNQGNGIQIFVSCIYPFLSGKSRYFYFLCLTNIKSVYLMHLQNIYLAVKLFPYNSFYCSLLYIIGVS